MNSTDETGEMGWGRGRHGRCGRGGRGWRKKLIFIPFVIAALVIKAALAMWLWNELIPDLFHGPALSYLQAIELVVLVKILFGFGGRGPMGRMRHMHHGMHHRFAHLSPEEKERIMNELKKSE